MKVDNISPLNFRAVRIVPKAEIWDKDILNAVMDSKAIKNFIQRNERKGKDTFLRCETGEYKVPLGFLDYQGFSKHKFVELHFYKDYRYYGDKHFSVSGKGNTVDIAKRNFLKNIKDENNVNDAIKNVEENELRLAHKTLVTQKKDNPNKEAFQKLWEKLFG